MVAGEAQESLSVCVEHECIYLWAIGVGSSIAGYFFGWQKSLVGGFGSGLIALGLVALLYWCLVSCIAELSARFHGAGGAYTFAQRIINRQLGTVVAVLEIVKLVGCNCVIAMGISNYVIESVDDIHEEAQYVIWAALYVVYACLDILGFGFTCRFNVLSTTFCVFLLSFYYCSTSVNWNFRLYAIGDGWFHDGWEGFAHSLPFSVWFFLGFESLPIAADKTLNVHTVGNAMWSSFLTLVTLSSLMLVFASSTSPGALTMASSDAPLMDGLLDVYGMGTIYVACGCCIVIGLMCSFQSFVFFTSELLFAVARDGMLPYSLSVIHPFFKAPVRAIVIGQGFGLIVTCLIGALWGATKGSNICVITSLFAAMCSYLIQMHCFLRARRTPSSAQAGADPGPLMSPLGAPGAYLAMTLVAGVLCCLVYLVTSSSDYRLGLVSIFALGIVIVTTMQAVSARPNSGLVTTGAQRVIV